MNEILSFQHEGRSLTFATLPSGRRGALIDHVAAFLGTPKKNLEELLRTNKTEFLPSESWVETVASADPDNLGRTAKPRPRKFLDAYGANRAAMKTESPNAVTVRNFFLYTVLPEWLASKQAPRLDRTDEAMRLLGNALADKSKLTDVADKLGALASQMFAEIKRQHADERAAKLIDEAGVGLFTGKGALTSDDNAVISTLSTSGPYPTIKALAKAAKLTQRATAASLSELAGRGIVRREKGLIDVAPRGPKLLDGGSEVAS